MEHGGGGAPAGAASDMGQATGAVSYEGSFDSSQHESEFDTSFSEPRDSNGISEESIGFGFEGSYDAGESHDETGIFPEDEPDTQDSGGDMAEGEIISFGGEQHTSGEQEITEPEGEREMNPDVSLEIAKTDGFDAALEYYADFGSVKTQDTAGQVADSEQVEGQDEESETDDLGETDAKEQVEDSEQEEDSINNDKASNQDQESGRPQDELMQNPEIQEMLKNLKNQSELMKMMIERLQEQQKLTQEMLLMMAMIMKETLENKKEKDEGDQTLMGALTKVIGFLIGMITDPEKEAKRVEGDAEKAM